MMNCLGKTVILALYMAKRTELVQKRGDQK